MTRALPTRTVGLTLAGIGLIGLVAATDVSLASRPGNMMSLDLTVAQIFTVNIGF